MKAEVIALTDLPENPMIIGRSTYLNLLRKAYACPPEGDYEGDTWEDVCTKLEEENKTLRERIAFEASLNAELKERLEHKTNSSN